MSGWKGLFFSAMFCMARTRQVHEKRQEPFLTAVFWPARRAKYKDVFCKSCYPDHTKSHLDFEVAFLFAWLEELFFSVMFL